jgi:hypothetical protein
VIVGSRKKDEVYVLKRAGWPSPASASLRRPARTSVNVKVDVPAEVVGDSDVAIWCVSDCYIGVECVIENVELQ